MTQVPLEGTIIWVDEFGLIVSWEEAGANEVTWVGDGGEVLTIGPIIVPRPRIGLGFAPNYSLLGVWNPEPSLEGVWT